MVALLPPRVSRFLLQRPSMSDDPPPTMTTIASKFHYHHRRPATSSSLSVATIDMQQFLSSSELNDLLGQLPHNESVWKHVMHKAFATVLRWEQLRHRHYDKEIAPEDHAVGDMMWTTCSRLLKGTYYLATTAGVDCQVPHAALYRAVHDEPPTNGAVLHAAVYFYNGTEISRQWFAHILSRSSWDVHNNDMSSHRRRRGPPTTALHVAVVQPDADAWLVQRILQQYPHATQVGNDCRHHSCFHYAAVAAYNCQDVDDGGGPPPPPQRRHRRQILHTLWQHDPAMAEHCLCDYCCAALQLLGGDGGGGKQRRRQQQPRSQRVMREGINDIGDAMS